MKKHAIVLVSLLATFAARTEARSHVVGYLPTWGDFPASVHAVDLGIVTHLDVAFVTPDAQGAITLPTGIDEVVRTAHGRNVKVLVSIGGGGANDSLYGSLLGNQSLADQLVANLVKTVVDNSLDGIDVDIEGDVLDGKSVTSAQYETFVTKLGIALHAKQKLMTAALGGWFANLVTNSAVQQFDLLGVMSYDAFGSWSATPGQHSSYQMAVDDFDFWTKTKGMPADRVLVGVPFYGYGWGKYKQDWRYADLVTGFPGAENQDQIGSGTDVIYYNGMPTIHDKAVFAKQNAGGIMIWEMTQDVQGPKSLLGVIGGVVGRHDTTVPDNIAKGRPVQASSTESGPNIGANATDGLYATRWASAESDSQWISVDLGSNHRIDRVKITWEAAYGKDYVVETSTDGQNWSSAKSVSGNTTLVNDHSSLGTFGRYLRIRCTARGTSYGYSVYEIEAYGEPVASEVDARSSRLRIVPGARLRLRDIHGRVLSDRIAGSGETPSMSIIGPAHPQPGMYFLEVRTNSDIQILKLLSP